LSLEGQAWRKLAMGLIEVFCPGMRPPLEPKRAGTPNIKKKLLLDVARAHEEAAAGGEEITDGTALARVGRPGSKSALDRAKNEFRAPKNATWWRWVIENVYDPQDGPTGFDPMLASPRKGWGGG
jgi:hypothetical protein